MKWIYSQDKLPDEAIEVLAIVEYSSSDRIEILKFDPLSIKWRWQNEAGKKYRTKKVICWMPLPEFPDDT